MQIIFESRGLDGVQMQEHSVKRVRFALRRLSSLVPRARLQFSDVNGPRGGLDKRCRVELNTLDAGAVITTSVAGDWRSALDHALSSATQVLKRSLQRKHKPVRGRMHRLTFES